MTFDEHRPGVPSISSSGPNPMLRHNDDVVAGVITAAMRFPDTWRRSRLRRQARRSPTSEALALGRSEDVR
jgi:hypothetical protein